MHMYVCIHVCNLSICTYIHVQYIHFDALHYNMHTCIRISAQGGDLYFAILECHHFSEKDVAIAMWSLGHALMYLHNHHTVHRGVSAESIFVSTIKLW